jgi:hypothetical protein
MNHKIVKSVLLLAATMIGVLFSIPHEQVAAQEIISGNLFTNPGFETGYFNQDGIPQIAVPNGWRMHWLDGVAFEGTEGVVAYRPETVVWYIEDAPENERTLFWQDGSFTLKLFKPWAPVFVALSQDVSNLEVGRNYRMSVPIFVDMVGSYDGGNKVQPYRSDSGFVRFSVGSAGTPWRSADLTYSPTWTAENVFPFYLAKQTYSWDFTATAESMTIFIEMGSRHPWENSGFFMDGVGLYALGTTSDVPVNPGSGGGGSAAPAGPTATPFPTPTPRPDGAIIHTVNSGESFWTIAIQYAPALGVTPEEALPLIRDLNGNPAFLTLGQEVIIKEPGEIVVAPEPTVETTAEDVVDNEEVIEVEGTNDEEPVAEVADTAVSAEAAVITGTICVSAFDDQNGDGSRNDATEGLQADAAITIFRGGSTVSTYITDGSSEPYCFENLTPDTYQVQIFPPADFQPTTSPSWAVSVAEGARISVGFGTRFSSAETAVANTTAADESTEDTAVSPSADDAEAIPADDGGFFGSIGGIVLVVAAILVLLAGVGVVMLRRG